MGDPRSVVRRSVKLSSVRGYPRSACNGQRFALRQEISAEHGMLTRRMGRRTPRTVPLRCRAPVPLRSRSDRQHQAAIASMRGQFEHDWHTVQQMERQR